MKLLIAVAFGLMIGSVVSEYSTVRTMCNDGSLSQSVGKGACSHHGGVKYTPMR